MTTFTINPAGSGGGGGADGGLNEVWVLIQDNSLRGIDNKIFRGISRLHLLFTLKVSNFRKEKKTSSKNEQISFTLSIEGAQNS